MLNGVHSNPAIILTSQIVNNPAITLTNQIVNNPAITLTSQIVNNPAITLTNQIVNNAAITLTNQIVNNAAITLTSQIVNNAAITLTSQIVNNAAITLTSQIVNNPAITLTIIFYNKNKFYRNLIKNKRLNRLEDIDGKNYIVLSKLNRFEDVLTTDKYSIKSVAQGVEQYTVSREDHHLFKDNFMIVNPGQEVEVIIDSIAEDVVGVCYFFDPQLVRQIRFSSTHSLKENLEHIDPAGEITFESSPIHAHQTFLHTHIGSVKHLMEWDKYQLSEYLILLAEEMLKHHSDTKKKLNLLEGSRKVTRKELYKRIQRGRQYIHDQFHETISLKEIARSACLSEYYFHRNFHHYFGQTPYQYLHQVRMSQASQLFQSDNWSRAEVAARCGYQDTKYFSKSYKKWLTAQA